MLVVSTVDVYYFQKFTTKIPPIIVCGHLYYSLRLETHVAWYVIINVWTNDRYKYDCNLLNVISTSRV